MKVGRERIKRLMEQVREIHHSPQNQARAQYWQVVPHEQWEPGLIRTLPARRAGGKLPFVVEPGLTMWSEILDFDLRAYWEDPLTFVTAQLEMKVYHARHFQDDTFIEKGFRLLYAMLLEGSVMGMPYGFTDEGYPWIDYTTKVIGDEADLDRLAEPDFHTSGVMPTILRFYDEMRTVLDDDFLVTFPDWLMGPFGVACQLRGFDQFLMDLLREPQFSHRVLDTVVRSRLSWQAQCDRFLGIERARGVLGNDDVNCPTLSPWLYADVLLPRERYLSGVYGGISYWHSCGDTTRLLPDIARIPTIDLFHCGPWTDVGEACRVMGDRGVAVEICLDPVDKVQGAAPEGQKGYLEETAAQIPASTNCYIKVDSLEVITDLESELAAIGSWIGAARDVLE
jgi:hypothetical protein